MAVAVMVILLATLVSSAAFAQEELTIGVGEQKIVSVPVGSDIGFTGPLHIVQLDPERIKIIGDGPGLGSITIKNGTQVVQYNIQVVSIPPEQAISQMKALLHDMKLTFSAVGDKVIVEGQIETTQDLERFNKVMEAFPDVINMVVITAREALIDVAVTLVEVDATSAQTLGLLNMAPASGTISLNSANPIPIAGVNWGALGQNLQMSLAVSSQLLEALDAELECGRAKVIDNPRIVTISGKEATISSGGQIPYRVVGSTGTQGIEYLPYGVTMRVTPEERPNDVVLQLHIDASEPVGAVTGSSENPLTSRSVDLNVAIGKDRTLAIAGLYNAVTSRQTQGGCFFPLFAASASLQRREIIVLVTPRMAPDGIGPDYFKMVKPEDTRR
jgi:Flp pilus assembly secretin CpaC